jgi:hypothetical protein
LTHLGAETSSQEATLSAALYTEAKKKDGPVILVERGVMRVTGPRFSVHLL